jgi:hypothetical protein
MNASLNSIISLHLFSSIENPKSQYIPILPNKSQTPILPTLHLIFAYPPSLGFGNWDLLGIW